MMLKYFGFLFALFCSVKSQCQTRDTFFVKQNIRHHKISAYLPKDTVLFKNYVFYLHGRIIEEHTLLEEATDPSYGVYNYANILDSLVNKGKNIVISEHRKKLTDVYEYAGFISSQIDTLLKRGVAPNRICVVGASKGGLIAMYVSSIVKNKKVKYVWLACCGDDIECDSALTPWGFILSIIEKTDKFAGSCYPVYKKNYLQMTYRELEIYTGLSHGFLYNPNSAWLQPTLNWINEED